ncbi:MAG: Gfo/Idh/MocA family oxidoreductase [Gemmatimonadota bacterium]|nr:Gfo/Idh/MocA family oxidoreductase [Gemmatimonadota bacterium]
MTAARLGFVGLGHITVNAHLPPLAALAEKGDVTLQAFCDVDGETAAGRARTFGANAVYTDHREMFDKEDLDGVYICIPPTLHTDAELIAAEKGIPVMVEKPQTLDVAQAVRFSEAIRKAGVPSQVGFMSRYYATAEFMRDRVSERTPRHALVQLLYSGGHIRYWTSRFELCGGSFVENTIHMVDLLRFFLGDIAEVSAFYHYRKPGEGPHPINLPHVYDVNYRFENGVVASVTTSRVLTNVNASRREVLVVCDDSLLEWSAETVIENGEAVFESPGADNAFARQAREFVNAIRSGDASELRNGYPQALNSLAAVLGANASASEGGALIRLEEFVRGTAGGRDRTRADAGAKPDAF